jgi:hypothetical protein
LTPAPSITPTTGRVYTFIAGATNTGALTLNISATGAASVILNNGNALRGNEVITGRQYLISYTGSAYKLLNPSSDWKTYAPTPTGFSVSPTSTAYRYKVDPDGNKCTLLVRQATPGTSNSTSFTIPLPITAATVTNGAWIACTTFQDNGVPVGTFGLAVISSAGTSVTLYTDNLLAGWTASNGKLANFTIEYEI